MTELYYDGKKIDCKVISIEHENNQVYLEVMPFNQNLFAIYTLKMEYAKSITINKSKNEYYISNLEGDLIPTSEEPIILNITLTRRVV